jgi:hypothetical protein
MAATPSKCYGARRATAGRRASVIKVKRPMRRVESGRFVTTFDLDQTWS